MKAALALLLVLANCLPCGHAAAQELPRGSLLQVLTRDVQLPVYAVWKTGAQATVLLYSGGAGGFGKLGADGWPASANFLIRSAKYWAPYPVNLVMVGRPPDIANLDGYARTGDKHAADNLALLREVKRHSAAPVWLVGTSMGTISAAAAAIQDQNQLVAGVVLTSSITSLRKPGAVPSQALGNIRVPVLVMHHRNDACAACNPADAQRIVDGLSGAPVKKLLLVDGGSNPTGDPCEALHWHGYIGMEQQAVALMADWVMHPSP